MFSYEYCYKYEINNINNENNEKATNQMKDELRITQYQQMLLNVRR